MQTGPEQMLPMQSSSTKSRKQILSCIKLRHRSHSVMVSQRFMIFHRMCLGITSFHDVLSQVSRYHDVYLWLNSSMADMFTTTYRNYFIDDQLLVLTGPTLRQKRIKQGGLSNK